MIITIESKGVLREERRKGIGWEGKVKKKERDREREREREREGVRERERHREDNKEGGMIKDK